MRFAYEPEHDDHSWHGWRRLAACRDEDTNLFFPNGETGEALDQAEAAKAICAACPVRLECLKFAVTTNQPYGIFGGLNESERKSLRRRMRRDRSNIEAAVAKAG